MDTIDRGTLEGLMETNGVPCVSLYMPTHLTELEALQDAPRLKNLLRDAEERLIAQGMRAAEAPPMLEEAAELPGDFAWWQGRGRGLALFLTPERSTFLRLRTEVGEFVSVGPRFHLKPLVAVLHRDREYFVLTVSLNDATLFRAGPESIEPVVAPGLPARFADAHIETDVPRGSQTHSASNVGRGKQAAVFHGHGGEPDGRKQDVEKFCRHLSTVVDPVLHGERLPLLLAGVDYVLPIYRMVDDYPYTLDVALTGNFDDVPQSELHERAAAVMQPWFDRELQEVAGRYRALAGTGKASDDIREILRSGHEGRTDVLLVDRDAHQWGSYDAETGQVDVHDEYRPGDEDLLDVAVLQTLRQRGVVYALDRSHLPTESPTAALMRY